MPEWAASPGGTEEGVTGLASECGQVCNTFMQVQPVQGCQLAQRRTGVVCLYTRSWPTYARPGLLGQRGEGCKALRCGCPQGVCASPMSRPSPHLGSALDVLRYTEQKKPQAFELETSSWLSQYHACNRPDVSGTACPACSKARRPLLACEQSLRLGFAHRLLACQPCSIFRTLASAHMTGAATLGGEAVAAQVARPAVCCKPRVAAPLCMLPACCQETSARSACLGLGLGWGKCTHSGALPLSIPAQTMNNTSALWTADVRSKPTSPSGIGPSEVWPRLRVTVAVPPTIPARSGKRARPFTPSRSPSDSGPKQPSPGSSDAHPPEKRSRTQRAAARDGNDLNSPPSPNPRPGVSWHSSKQTWQVYAPRPDGGGGALLGYYGSQQEAARAYEAEVLRVRHLVRFGLEACSCAPPGLHGAA